MARPTKSLDPVDRLGVYKRLGDVPNRYRLSTHASAYEGRDVWQEFCEVHEYAQGSHERYEEEVDRAGGRWKSFMQGQQRHHALAMPEDVEAWSADLLSEGSVRRAHDYWIRVNRFYDWLQWHTEHPHRYNPALMAAAEGDATAEVWNWKAERTLDRREYHRRNGNE